jgi:hypothetical protein
VSDSRGASRDNTTIAELKRLGAVNLVITLSDGTERKAALSAHRNRWDKLAKLVDALDWHVIEAYDKAGGLLGRVESDGEPPDVGEFEDSGENLERLAKVMLEVMRSTQRETRLMFAAQMEGQGKVIQSMIEGYRAQADAYASALKVSSAAQLAGAAEHNPEMQQMMQMAMALLMAPKAVPPVQVKP